MSGQAITELRKTAWYLVTDDGEHYTDADGHMWFSYEVIRPIARELGMMPFKTGGTGLKQVVTGYAV